MVYRLTWIGIAAGLLLALLRMENLLRPATVGPAWQLVLVAALLLGSVITWVARSYRMSPMGIVVANLAGLLLATIRIGGPDTALLGFIPTGATVADTWRELVFGLDLIRFGTAPIVPVAGLILILTWIFWLVGVLIVWGLSVRKPAVAIVPGVVLYLQLATMDRSPTNTAATIVYLAVLIATIAAVAHDERTVGTGRVRGADRRFRRGGTATTPIAIAVLILLLGVGSTVYVSNRNPDVGALNWRTTGFGNGLFGGVSFNHFVGIQQSLVNLSNVPVFTANVQGAVDEETLYWKLIALEDFDGTNWFPRTSMSTRPEETGIWEAPDQVFQGPVVEVTSTVTIDALAETYLPAPYSPTDLSSGISVLNETYRVRPDGAIKWDARTQPGMEYQVRSNVPQPSLSVLASNRGELSPMFAQAARDGDFTHRSENVEGSVTFDVETREKLTDTSALDPEDRRILRGFTDLLTDAGATNFERAVILEDFFRDSSLFTYNTQVATGHSAQNIVDWLLDENSPNYREGYCEQFAASMAIMARTLGIPARVILGFAPGDVAADGTVTVRESDAHSWVELWFNTQGWVRFDPTPRSAGDNPPLSASLGFDPGSIVIEELEIEEVQEGDPGFIDFEAPLVNLEELLRILEAEQPPELVGAPIPVFEEQPGTPWGWIVLGVLIVGTGVPPVLRWWRRRRRIERMREGDITAAWNEIVDELADLGEPVSAAATPLEAAAAVSRHMVPLASAYQEQIYGPDTDLPEKTVRAARASYGRTHQHLVSTRQPHRRLMRWMRVGSLRRR